MTYSVGDAISKSFNRTMLMLFKPFDAGKWFVLGFCAWLAYLGEPRFSLNFGGNFSSPHQGGGSSAPDLSAVRPWITEHLAVLAILGVSFITLLLVVGAVVAWLRARGHFMFLDGVARNRGAVVEPWRQFRHLGNSLFWVKLVLFLSYLLGFFLIMGLGLLLAWGNIAAGQFGLGAILGLVAVVLLVLPWVFVFLLIRSLLHDFVVPVMYLRNVRTLAGWRIFRHEILPGHVGNFVIFYLVKFGLAILLGLIPLVACCLTCCLAGGLFMIPYLGAVLFLPLYVFMRCYSLYFLEQAGPQWHIFADESLLIPVAPVVAHPVSDVSPPAAL